MFAFPVKQNHNSRLCRQPIQIMPIFRAISIDAPTMLKTDTEGLPRQDSLPLRFVWLDRNMPADLEQ